MTSDLFRDQHTHVGDLVIPCIDVADGRATTPSRIAGLEGSDDVAAISAVYAAGSAQKLFLDVFDGWDAIGYLPDLLRRLKDTGVDLLVSVGHGTLPSVDHAQRLLRAGADAVSVSTSLVEEPGTVEAALQELGGQRIMAVINSRATGPSQWNVHIHDGAQDTGMSAVALAAELAELQVGSILANSIDREGTGRGFDLALTRAVASVSGLPVIASGGCGTLSHLQEALSAGDTAYVLVNNMLHNGQHSISEVRDYLYTYSSFGTGPS
ncbi:HisA/HisF-related TIM barrel protein [Streptomyces cyaneofuscatus]|uniref:HisA/HisF-related TIM barrel protein n=1 Tax=Streptomyces cyaneofuscatus TaxID=66883 RepID=UPI0029550F05|nr:HisA/HisF-related TIM barrel protein [Streptomyces cyaneofuscatus]WOP07033.1 HisA/HisF-related TIM barrel protein [Streptomyces cyaneofuscatus]